MLRAAQTRPPGIEIADRRLPCLEANGAGEDRISNNAADARDHWQPISRGCDSHVTSTRAQDAHECAGLDTAPDGTDVGIDAADGHWRVLS